MSTQRDEFNQRFAAALAQVPPEAMNAIRERARGLSQEELIGLILEAVPPEVRAELLPEYRRNDAQAEHAAEPLREASAPRRVPVTSTQVPATLDHPTQQTNGTGDSAAQVPAQRIEIPLYGPESTTLSRLAYATHVVNNQHSSLNDLARARAILSGADYAHVSSGDILARYAVVNEEIERKVTRILYESAAQGPRNRTIKQNLDAVLAETDPLLQHMGISKGVVYGQSAHYHAEKHIPDARAMLQNHVEGGLLDTSSVAHVADLVTDLTALVNTAKREDESVTPTPEMGEVYHAALVYATGVVRSVLKHGLSLPDSVIFTTDAMGINSELGKALDTITTANDILEIPSEETVQYTRPIPGETRLEVVPIEFKKLDTEVVELVRQYADRKRQFIYQINARQRELCDELQGKDRTDSWSVFENLNSPEPHVRFFDNLFELAMARYAKNYNLFEVVSNGDSEGDKKHCKIRDAEVACGTSAPDYQKMFIADPQFRSCVDGEVNSRILELRAIREHYAHLLQENGPSIAEILSHVEWEYEAKTGHTYQDTGFRQFCGVLRAEVDRESARHTIEHGVSIADLVAPVEKEEIGSLMGSLITTIKDLPGDITNIVRNIGYRACAAILVAGLTVAGIAYNLIDHDTVQTKTGYIASDLNQDGKTDLLSVDVQDMDPFTIRYRVTLGNDRVTFGKMLSTAPVYVRTPADISKKQMSYQPDTFGIADANEDGHGDLILASPSGNIFVYHNDGKGKFTPPIEVKK